MTMAVEHSGLDAHSSLPSRREVVGWLAAGAVVLTLHAGAAMMFQRMTNVLPAAEQEAAMVVELAPVPFVAPSEVDSELVPEKVAPEEAIAAPGTETPSEDTESATIKRDVVDTAEEVPVKQPAPVAEEPVQEASIEPVTEPAAESEITAPELVEAVTPEVAVPLPMPKPKVEPEPQPKKAAEKPKTEPLKKAPKAKPAEKVAEKPAERQATLEAAPAPKSHASMAPTVSHAKWQAKVLAWINRHKPRSARARGVVQVRFQIDPSGSVLSANVIRSSGDDALDQAAINIVMRSSPVPPPPSEIARNRMSLSLPVEFKR
ncbi:protein TonB [Mesorhizobium soli]|uniref:TonB family protein n=1 Tax=Pseudaminobacter soli (ex Li et al. 2025) TaxID=1295366 RepID=UPI002475147E|nr:TonB family protein [Mesorhizobium soli]MDH6232043.1 protein TonB [Mesorhizobium soli]